MYIYMENQILFFCLFVRNDFKEMKICGGYGWGWISIFELRNHSLSFLKYYFYQSF